jgi:hypothetical protein
MTKFAGKATKIAIDGQELNPSNQANFITEPDIEISTDTLIKGPNLSDLTGFEVEFETEFGQHESYLLNNKQVTWRPGVLPYSRLAKLLHWINLKLSTNFTQGTWKTNIVNGNFSVDSIDDIEINGEITKTLTLRSGSPLNTQNFVGSYTEVKAFIENSK